MKYIFIILFFFISSLGFSQSKNEINILHNIYDTNKHTHNFSFAKRNNTNEIKQLFTGFFLVYKEFISSQDANSCVFYPSCSVYAIQSIKSKGAVLGLLDAFDRLTRCNKLSPEQYQIHHKTKLMYNPVN